MTNGKFRLHDGETGTALAVRVIPRARKNEMAGGLKDGTIKIRLTSPPIEDRANQALIAFLADLLDLPRARIQIVAGHKGRNKLVAVLGADASAVEKKLLSK